MINVYWHNNERMSSSSCYMLNQMLDCYECEHQVKPNYPRQGSVVVFHGGNHRNPQILNYIGERLPWVIFVSVGDEGCEFPYEQIKHPNMLLWVQTPKPGKVTADRYLLEGYPHDCQRLVEEAGNPNRHYDWMFFGQVTHDRRYQLYEQLKKYEYGPHALMATQSFGAGVTHELYYQIMKESLVVPCPAGPATPDSFRFAEALEAGAIPVIDAFALDRVEGYWDMVIPNHPFIVVKDWGEFPDIMQTILQPKNRRQLKMNVREWWNRYKWEFGQWLKEDLGKLGAKI